METVNPLLTSALEFLREGNVEAAEAGFGEAASACCEAYGEARFLDPKFLVDVVVESTEGTCRREGVMGITIHRAAVPFAQIDIITARTLAHQARTSSLRGKKEFAIQIYERILRIHEALPVPLSYDHAIALSELAMIRDESGSQEEADKLRARAHGIVSELASRSHQASVKAGGRESTNDTSGESSGEDDDETQSSSSKESDDNETEAGPTTAEETFVTNA